MTEANEEIEQIKLAFDLEKDSPSLVDEWQLLVKRYDCKGKSSHDARIVAAMNIRNITQLITFNMQDFVRYTHLTLIDPMRSPL